MTAAQALKYINGDGDGAGESDEDVDDSNVRISSGGLLIGPDDDDDDDRLQMGRVVAKHVYEQILNWHQFTGMWLGIGDEVEHLEPEGGVFRIVGRLFGLYPRRIGFTAQFRALEWPE